MVKIAGRDVLATWKVLISLGVAPVLYTFYAALATITAAKANASSKWKIMTPALVFIALPIMNYASLKFGEAGMDVLKCVIYCHTSCHISKILKCSQQVTSTFGNGSRSWPTKIPRQTQG